MAVAAIVIAGLMILPDGDLVIRLAGQLIAVEQPA
jgi:hypothetical protein